MCGSALLGLHVIASVCILAWIYFNNKEVVCRRLKKKIKIYRKETH